MEHFSETHKKFFCWLANFVNRLPWLVVFVAGILTIVSIIYLHQNFDINTDNEDMLSAELAFRRDSIALSAAFPQYSDNLLVVIDAGTPELADRAAIRLTHELRKKTDIFKEVYYPQADQFFRKNGLLFWDVEELYSLSEHLTTTQPLLGILWQDPTLRGFSRMLSFTVENFDSVSEVVSNQLSGMLDAVSDVGEAQLAGSNLELSWTGLFAGQSDHAAELEDVRRFIVLRPNLDFSSLRPGKIAMDKVRTTAVKLGLTAKNGVSIRLTGSAALSSEELESVEEGMGIAGLVSLTFVTICLLMGLRSFSLFVAIFLTLALGLLWTSAFAIAALGSLNLISVAFAVLFIGLGVDLGIHYTLRYKEEKNTFKSRGEALFDTAASMSGPLSLCAVTSAAAFYSFLPTHYIGLAELGLIAGTGMFIALGASFTLIPALISILPCSSKQLQTKTLLFNSFYFFSRDVAWAIIAIFSVASIFALTIIPRVNFDFDPLNLKDKKTESVSTLLDIQKNGQARYTIKILAPSLESGRLLVSRIKKLEIVEDVRSIDSFLPTYQEEKLTVINDLAFVLLPSLHKRDEPPPLSEGERLSAIESISHSLEKIKKITLDENLIMTADRLKAVNKQLIAIPSHIKGFEARIIDGFAAKVVTLKKLLTAEKFTLNDLPSNIRSRMLTEDGRVRLEVIPKKDLGSQDKLLQFVDEVRRLAPNATGAPVVILEAGRTVIRAFIEAGGVACIVIAIILFLIFKRFDFVAIAFIPVFIAGLLTFGTTSLFGIELNFANIIVLPLLFGLTIDFSIHLILRIHEGTEIRNLFATSTTRAVILSAITTIGSFGSIMLSNHPGTASMGLLLTIAIIFGLICSLGLIPAIFLIMKE